MTIRTLFGNMISAAVFVLACMSTAARAETIPADAIDTPKVLWRMVMEDFYGPYDKALKCWTARMGVDHVCMRPHRLDQVEINGVNHIFLVIGGPLLDEAGQPREAHVDSAALGLVVLKENGNSLKLVARNDLHTPFGTFGSLPGEDQFAVREIGPNESYGWVATSGWMGQGHVIMSSTIFATIGDTVVSIGDIPNHYDNMGNCENGKIIGSDTACADYSSTLLFDSSDHGSRFFPVIVKVAGSREGAAIDQTFTKKFDPGTLSYGKIEGMPKEFDQGI
ncbi:MAG: hypothetical protein JWL86_6279 [Rhizobium sp.]|nr:hypothetical protein [Rhizobium sp.]